MTRRTRITLAALIAASLICLPGSAMASQWQWGATIYGWFSDVGLDVSINDQELIEGEIGVDQIIDKLDFVFYLNIQGQRDSWGMMLDISYIDFGGDPVRKPLPGFSDGELVIEGDLEQTLIDFAALYNPRGDGLGFTLFGGVRILDIDQEIRAHISTPAGPSDSRRYTTSGTLLDALIGARWATSFADSWLFSLKGDTSFGDSEFTLGGVALLGYSFGKEDRYTLLAAYRYLEIEMQDEGQGIKVERRLSMSGGLLGLRIAF